MKSYRLFLAVLAIGFFGACESPTVPRYPDEDEDTQEDPDPDPRGGFLLDGGKIYFV